MRRSLAIQNGFQLPGVLTQSECPSPELPVVVYRPHPPLRSGFLLPVLLRLEAFHLQDDHHLPPIVMALADQIVRAILVSHSLPFIGNGEIQVVIARIGDHFWHLFELVRYAVLPPGCIEDNVADVTLGRANTWARGTKEDLGCRTDRPKFFNNRENRRFTSLNIRFDGFGQTLDDPLLILKEGHLLPRDISFEDDALLQVLPHGVEHLGKEDVPCGPLFSLFFESAGQFSSNLIYRCLERFSLWNGLRLCATSGPGPRRSGRPIRYPTAGLTVTSVGSLSGLIS